jgi:hypothetical protein
MSIQNDDAGALEAYCIKGKNTVFEFMASWCEACENFNNAWEKSLEIPEDMVLIRYDIGSWDAPAVAKYIPEATQIPYFVVYDSHCIRKVAFHVSKPFDLIRNISNKKI